MLAMVAVDFEIVTITVSGDDGPHLGRDACGEIDHAEMDERRSDGRDGRMEE